MSNESSIDLTELLGSKVQFGISDPWDVGIDAPIPATIVAVQQRMILLRLDAPLTYRGHTLHYVVGTARHVGHNFDTLPTGQGVSANFSPAPSAGIQEEPTAEKLFAAAAAWRAWHFIGGIQVAPKSGAADTF
jgi:hypothetical protein